MMTDYREILGELLVAGYGFDGLGPGQVRNDSRRVLPGDVFVAIEGSRFDGHEFIPQAINAGAQTVVCRKKPEKMSPQVTYIEVTDTGCAYARLVRAFCGEPDLTLPLFGVTGTNGKTTTAYLLEHLFRFGGVPCGLISTVEYRDGKTVTPACNTTPEAGLLFPMLKTMRRNGMQVTAMELSSHALTLGRISGARFHTAIFTNLTGDHLDFHKTMENYYQAKRKLFSEHLAMDGNAVINVDDPYGQRLAEECGSRNVMSFGTSPAAGWQLRDVKLSADGADFKIVREGKIFAVRSPLIGEHNVYNLTGAILAVLNYGLGEEAVRHALTQPIQVPGRLEKFTTPAGAAIYVDYAHTDDALAHVLSTLRPLTRGKLTVIFGAGGDRDRTKRPRMGKTAAELADAVILTNDNPRTEKPEEIIREIRSGMPENFSCTVEPDRGRAIALGVSGAGSGDTVLVAGKGHENYQEIAGVRHHFDDREVIFTLLRNGR